MDQPSKADVNEMKPVLVINRFKIFGLFFNVNERTASLR